MWNDYNPATFQDWEYFSYGWIVRSWLWNTETEMKKYKFMVRDQYKNVITEIDLNFKSWSLYHTSAVYWRNEIIARFKSWDETFFVWRFQEFTYTDESNVRIERTAFFVFTSLWRFRIIIEEIPILDYNLYEIWNKFYFKIHNWYISVWDDTMQGVYWSKISQWVNLWDFWNSSDRRTWWAPKMDFKVSNIYFWSWYSWLIYFRSWKFYFTNFYNNNSNYEENEIFYWGTISSIPEYRINLSPTYKTWIKKSNIVQYTRDWFQFFLLSMCRDTEALPIPWGSANNVILQTKYNIENPGFMWQIDVNYFQYWFLDYVNWWRTIKTTDNQTIIDYWAECTTDYWYSNFLSWKPNRVYWIKLWSLYYKDLKTTDMEKIYWTSWSEDVPPEFIDSTISWDDFLKKIFDLDWDWDWEIELWETAIAPVTILKNIITQIYNWFQNLWTFIETILWSTNLQIIPNVNASWSWMYESFKNWVVRESTDLINWETWYENIDKVAFNVKAWALAWIIFFLIIWSIVALREEWIDW